MKRTIKLLLRIVVLLVIMNSINTVYSQPEPPNGNAGEEGPIGGSAPVNGMWILPVLSACYGIRKYITRNAKHKTRNAEIK